MKAYKISIQSSEYEALLFDCILVTDSIENAKAHSKYLQTLYQQPSYVSISTFPQVVTILLNTAR